MRHRRELALIVKKWGRWIRNSQMAFLAVHQRNQYVKQKINQKLRQGGGEKAKQLGVNFEVSATCSAVRLNESQNKPTVLYFKKDAFKRLPPNSQRAV